MGRSIRGLPVGMVNRVAWQLLRHLFQLDLVRRLPLMPVKHHSDHEVRSSLWLKTQAE
ncbi:hypothetical protein ALO73_200110 [Pseudomonas syringae pv. daphniphylli]|uniref:Cag pathogenicity island protein Cag5 n=1 Tax=Pseudomonas syringae pv. daphniphylli TaxID=264455 RepID=A0A9X0KXL4_PSESX|nr:hypothetical protein ALO73_200110 [Pseudomonas syringae pv. daphniphylli]